MRKLTFAKAFWIWFAVDLAALFLNGATLQNPILASAIHAAIGVFLLFVPIYPRSFSRHWDDRTCRRYIRIIAAAQIAASFAIRINF